MGYTHYWHRETLWIPENLWAKALERVRPLIERAEKAELIHDVQVDGDMIFFNGQCETFVVEREFRGSVYNGITFSFCKTRRRDYDPVVVACLLHLTEVLGPETGFGWSTDGRYPEDHASGLEFAGMTIDTAPAPEQD